MPIACVRIPHFAIRVAVLDQPHLDGCPLILGTPRNGRMLVVDASKEASRTGIRAGQNVREAQALCPVVFIISPNPVREEAIAKRILERFQELSPLVEPDDREPGCWYIDLIGLDRHYGTPAQAARHILRTVPPMLKPQMSIAPTKFTARIAAGINSEGSIRTIDETEVLSFLANVPTSWLPVEPSLIAEMQRLGISTLGILAAMESGKVTARLGKSGRYAWELAHGIDRRQVIPTHVPPSVTEDLEMPMPVISREMLMIALRHLVTRAFQKRELRGRYVRQAVIRASLESSRSWERTLILKDPSDANRLMAALTLRLQNLEMPGPVESMSLELSGILNEAAHQESLPALSPRNMPSLKDVTIHLKQRYGSSPLYRVVEVEPWSRIPERRHALIPYDP